MRKFIWTCMILVVLGAGIMYVIAYHVAGRPDSPLGHRLQEAMAFLAGRGAVVERKQPQPQMAAFPIPDPVPFGQPLNLSQESRKEQTAQVVDEMLEVVEPIVSEPDVIAPEPIQQTQAIVPADLRGSEEQHRNLTPPMMPYIADPAPIAEQCSCPAMRQDAIATALKWLAGPQCPDDGCQPSLDEVIAECWRLLQNLNATSAKDEGALLEGASSKCSTPSVPDHLPWATSTDRVETVLRSLLPQADVVIESGPDGQRKIRVVKNEVQYVIHPEVDTMECRPTDLPNRDNGPY
jgi:hypothetical protein